MQFLRQKNNFGKFVLIFALLFLSGETLNISVRAAGHPSRGIVKGIVRDAEGNPIADAVVLLMDESQKVVRQIRSAADGSFAMRVFSGKYVIAAAAFGYSAFAFENVSVERSTQVVYNFNLRRVGSGQTLPEKRLDRNDAKWRIRSTASQRAILQNNEGTGETNAIAETVENRSSSVTAPSETEENARVWKKTDKKSETVIETFTVGSANPNTPDFVGVNFATLQPIKKNINLIISGQTSSAKDAPQRLETTAKIRATEDHNLTLRVSGAKINAFTQKGKPQFLGQVSLQAFDEWRVKEGVIVVVGLDYSRFVGSGKGASLSPRLGVQFEVNQTTRLNFGYTTQTEEQNWQKAVEFEDTSVIFRQPPTAPVVFAENKPQLPKMRRTELGIERVLDNNSSLETTAFFDLTNNRGVGLLNLPLNNLTTNEAITDNFSQNGTAQGLRLVYSRRLPKNVRASVGYAFGRGQKLSPAGITNPADLFVNSFFQTISAQVSANLTNDTEIKTIFRFSPEATVFAIDPFAGRMAVYDPSLSILVTQNLPRFGLPFEAKATIDARNIFDVQTTAENGETSLKLNTQRRSLRGGISVRF